MTSYDLFIVPVITLSSKEDFEGYMSSQVTTWPKGTGLVRGRAEEKQILKVFIVFKGPPLPQHVSSSRRSCCLKAGDDEAWRASDKLICVC